MQPPNEDVQTILQLIEESTEILRRMIEHLRGAEQVPVNHHEEERA